MFQLSQLLYITASYRLVNETGSTYISMSLYYKGPYARGFTSSGEELAPLLGIATRYSVFNS